MSKSRITQDDFDEILRKARASGRLEADRCAFPHCVELPDLTVKKPDREYGLCAEHWWLVSNSDVEL